jgi:protocatechuate 3,4-dioxygenase beta subunit
MRGNRFWNGPKEKDVRINAISLRRRHLMIAGVAGAAAPAAVFAGTGGSPREELVVSTFVGRTDGLVVSGRILGADSKPLAGATVEVWLADSQGSHASVSTDADGRFFTAVSPAGHGRPQDIRYRVSHGGRETSVKRHHFARGQMQRDEAGAWRATFGAALT